MDVEIQFDQAYKKPKIIILTASMTEDVNTLISTLSDKSSGILTGRKDDRIEILSPTDLIRVYANMGHIFAVTKKGEYTMRMRLYEIEERLGGQQFVRISNSEIIFKK